jgi:hypothetical protein
MPNTTNFNWSTPADTDLVKNGASAIRTLGSAIDTSFVDFKGGTTGQVLKKTSNTDLDVEWGTASSGLTLINTTSFSGVGSQSINDCFSATYDNYFLAITVDSITTSGQDLNLRLRVGGADNSSTNYRWSGFNTFDTGSSVTLLKSSGLDNRFRIGKAYVSTNMSFTGLTLVNPFRTEETGYWTSSIEYDGSNSIQRMFTGAMSVTTSYTGFSVFPDSQNITGKVSVYGYSL